MPGLLFSLSKIIVHSCWARKDMLVIVGEFLSLSYFITGYNYAKESSQTWGGYSTEYYDANIERSFIWGFSLVDGFKCSVELWSFAIDGLSFNW